MKKINLKDEFLKYYIQSTLKKLYSKYIKNFEHQNSFKKSSLVSMLSHHITIGSFTH